MRMRRLRQNSLMRRLVKETYLSVDDLIYPLFIVEGENIYEEIPSLPNVYHMSIDKLESEILELIELGINAVILFGIPNYKDSVGTSGFEENGIIQRAIKRIKEVSNDILVITDVCMCEYTDHGHCGILRQDGYVDNDKTLSYLSRIALSHAKAGADIIAPSDMMDHRVRAIRNTLDEHGYINTPIMAYSAKYASNYYGPFRDAADSAPTFGDRKTYQMDYHNSDEAMREIALDIEEGADFIMVKPALAYLDIINRARKEFQLPLVAYNVSGEYSIIMNAIDKGLVNRDIIYETLIAIKRAGAQLIITYHAKEIAKKLKEANI